MTERKPGNMSFDSWIEVQIREAQDRGEFDDLPGKGKPIAALDGRHDELWWVKQLMAREGLSYLPPALAVRREAEQVIQLIGELDSEADVRRVVGDLNERIREINRKPEIDGPPSTLMPLNMDSILDRWRVAQRRANAGTTEPPVAVDGSPPPPDPPAPARRRRWLRR